MLRWYIALGALIPFVVHAQKGYTLILENGSAQITSSLTEKGDSVDTDQGTISKRDILSIEQKGTAEVFNRVAGERMKVKLKETCRACRAGRLYAAKYAGSGMEPATFDPPLPAKWVADTLFQRFYAAELAERKVFVDEHGRVLTPAERIPRELFALGPYSVILANGDSLSCKEYYMQGDTLEFGQVRVVPKDVLLLSAPLQRWMFIYPTGEMVKVKEKLLDACAKARIAAERYKDIDAPFGSLAIPGSWLQDSSFLPCYRAWLEEAGIPTEENGDHTALAEGNGALPIGQPSQLIFRTGDTLILKKEFYEKDSLLCWYGGRCVAKYDLLLFRTVKGQFTYPHTLLRTRIPRPVQDLSMISLGRLYADKLWGSGLEWKNSTIPDSLRNNAVFVSSYRNEVKAKVEDAIKLNKKLNTLMAVSGGLSVAGAGMMYGALGAGIKGGRVAGELSKGDPDREMLMSHTPMPDEAVPTDPSAPDR